MKKTRISHTVQHYQIIPLRKHKQNKHNQKCGPIPNVMAALPNIGGALCSMTQSLADAHY